jgi:hypothetical protein
MIFLGGTSPFANCTYAVEPPNAERYMLWYNDQCQQLTLLILQGEKIYFIDRKM